MGIPIYKTSRSARTLIRRLLLIIGLAAIGHAPARGQSTIPPLPSLPVTFVFSNCDAGVTFKATILDWVRDSNGNISQLSVSKVVQPTSVTYTYLFWGSSTMTIGGNTQVSMGARLPDGSVGRSIGSLSIMYTNFGGSIPAATTFLLQTSNASGLGVGTGAASAGLAWSASFYGLGNLMPNGILSPMPPIGAWAPTNTFIQGDGKLLARPITDYGACSAGQGLIDLVKALGVTCDTPGCVSCGEPINLGNGNVFENVTDYQTFGGNKLGFTRYYNSLASTTTYAVRLGVNWRSNYDAYLRLSASSVIAERPDGRQVTFKLANGAWSTDTDLDYKLSSSGSTWTLATPDDSTETYNAIDTTEGLLKTIRARSGYTQTLQYESSNELTTVIDSYNQQLSFAYSNGRLSTLSTPDGLVLTYGYTGNKLTSVSFSTTPVTSQTYVYENTALPSALTGIVDENGNRYVTWTYDSKGRGTSSQFAGGAGLTRIAYNDTDGSRTVTNALGAQTVYKFTTLQNMPKVTEIDQAATADSPAGVIKYTYDSNGYTASQTDANGNPTNYVNDIHGQPASIVEAAGTPQARTTTIAFHPLFHLPVRVAQPGRTTTYTYDSNGEPLTRTVADTTATTVPYSTAGQTRTWTYTWSNFLMASLQKPRTGVNAVTTYTYDSSGILTALTNPLGQTTRIAQHSPGGLPETIVDPNGVTAQLTYDARLRLLSSAIQTAAGALTTTYNYDAAGNRTGVTLPDGSSVSSAFDAAHRQTGVSDLSNQSAAIVLDALGDRTKVSLLDSSGKPQRTRSDTFDALGRLMQRVRGAGQTATYTYDANGNNLTVTDPLKRVTQTSFDPLNRAVKVTDPNKGVTTTAYDAFNRTTSVTDPNGGVTTL